MAIYQRGRIFPGKRGAAEDFFCKSKKHRKIHLLRGMLRRQQTIVRHRGKKAHLTRWGVLFGSGMPTRLRYQKDTRHKARASGLRQRKSPARELHVESLGRVYGYKKMSTKTRGNRQNKKLNPERKLRPGSAWCEGETRGISSRFWSKLELPH